MHFHVLINVFLFSYVRCFIFNNISRVPINGDVLPDYYDWRVEGAVSPVQDQQSCGACWAFSAVANIESHVKIYLGEKIRLSEQFLIDCEVAKTGCQTTTVLKTFAQIVSIFGGVLQEKDYYLYSDRAERCRWDRRAPKPFPVVGFRRVLPDEALMVEYLYRYGPLSAAINSASMRHNYTPGTIDEPDEEQCSSHQKDLDHAVLLVGYSSYVDRATGKTTPYWIIKNSWGGGWGDGGYYYLVRGRNACGIMNDVSFSIVK